MLMEKNVTSVSGGSNRLFFTDPSLFILNISEQLLESERIGKFLLARAHGLAQSFITNHQSLLFLADVVSIKVSSFLELASLDCDAVNTILRGTFTEN